MNPEDKLQDQVDQSPSEQSNRRHASDLTPLGRIVAPIEQAFDAGDYALTSELLEQHPIAAWYGFAPDRFGRMLTTLIRHGGPMGGYIRVLGAFMAAGKPADVGNDESLRQTEPPGSFDQVGARVGEMFTLRVQGRPLEALRIANELKDASGLVLQPIFDSQQGLGLFSVVQHGVTAMLAGDFGLALSSFTQARMHVRAPELSFLTRDACVKAAIIEALYGDPRRAQSLLDEADGIPRTESWAEPVIDVCEAIASASLLVEQPDESMRMLAAVPLQEIGEMWPFYAEAVHRSLLFADRVGEARQQLEAFERMPLPRVEGQGYSGSILLLAAAQRAMLSGDIATARNRIERADSSIANTTLLAAKLELVSGRPREALNRIAGLREQTKGLRLFNLLRLSVSAGASFALGSLDECREVIRLVLKMSADLTPREALNFPVEVREFAEAEFEEWPRVQAGAKLGPDATWEQGAVLTIREQNLLHELVGEQTREQIAKSQFISMNTLKTHLRSVYRKLGVTSRTGAIIEAERRGMI